MESTIIYILLSAMIITVALVSVISRNRKIPTTGTVIPLHYPKIPAPKPSRIQSPFDGGGDDGGEDGDGFGAGRGGSCNGITVPFCGDSFSLLISDGFENIVDITVGLGGSGSLDAPTVTVKKPVDGSLHAWNRTVKSIELRLGGLQGDGTGIKASVQPLQRGHVIRIEGDGLGYGREVRFTRNNNRRTTSYNRQHRRYDDRTKSHKRKDRVEGDTSNRR